MTACVLDANVAAKWFLPPARETLTADALRLLEDYASGKLRLMAPDLFWPEFGNIFRKAVRQRRISSESAAAAVEVLIAMNIRAAPSAPLLKSAYAIAEAYDRTVYDATYVALAIASGLPLVTADERLANALTARFPVRWLGELG